MTADPKYDNQCLRAEIKEDASLKYSVWIKAGYKFITGFVKNTSWIQDGYMLIAGWRYIGNRLDIGSPETEKKYIQAR